MNTKKLEGIFPKNEVCLYCEDYRIGGCLGDDKYCCKIKEEK